MADGNHNEAGEEAGEPAIVMIGASAGGVQAPQAFVSALPARTGAAFVVVVHLDPERRSELPSILAARTKMPVIQVERTQKLEADHIFVIPPDRRLRLIDHQISAEKFDEPRGQRAPIDSFFRSVAERLGDGFAVILSGAGSDGAIGVRAVKESGGIILVQDPAEAEYGSMPRSAIATGVADFVLPAREIAERLADLVKIKPSAPSREDIAFDEELLRSVLAHLRVRTGHDFSKYKQSTVLRRIARRMQISRNEELRDYYEFLRNNAEEAQALLGDLLISVTTFFRDREAFKALSKHALPSLFAKRETTEPIRVWSCGCATGEEAYTLAILLLEEASRHDSPPPIQIFGSDLDTRALASAREARFPAAIEADVSEDRLGRFFIREGDHYRVRQEVRDGILFAAHDFLKDPPFSRVDLISCRNVLIYLDRELQEQVGSTFHYALNPGGFLLLGGSETAEQPSGLFRTVDRTARLYQSTAKAGEKPRQLPQLIGPARVRESIVQFGRAISPTVALGEAASHRRAIEKVAPPSVLVDDTHHVIHLSDNAGRYLMPSGGPLTGDIADLARPELRFELRSLLHRVFEQNLSTLSLPIPVRFNGAAHPVILMVKAVEDDGRPRHALVMFIEGEALSEGAGGTGQQSGNETVGRLSQELELTQSRLRTMREESDSANEELRAANEELQSINEEYRSTSEELETSREELQSINEELQTVNSELKHKVEEVSRTNSDLENLMAAGDYGTLFLDSRLRIKRFTERVTDLFSITAADEGRPITDFAHRLDYGDLVKDARTVLSELAPVRREAGGRNGRWYDVRMRPYRTIDNKIDGVVVTFVDMSEQRDVEVALRATEQRLLQEKRLVDLSRDPIFVWNFDDRQIVEWNRGCEELYGYNHEEALGQPKERLLKTPGSSLEAISVALLDRGHWSGELRQKTKAGREITVESRIELVATDSRRLAFESTRDITERKEWDRRQQLLLGELTHRVKNTLTVVQAIAHQTLRRTKSNKDFVEGFDGRLSALATAHGLLVESDWQGADLDALVRQQLQVYAQEKSGRVKIDGPSVLLNADLATPFGLILHELGTNAAKYGALSKPRGTVTVNWSVTGNKKKTLKLVWKERGGPAVKQPTATGFGSALINQGIPGARVDREFRPEGFVCTIELPLPEAGEHARGVQ